MQSHNAAPVSTIYLIRVLITSLQLRRAVTITVSGWCRVLAEYNAPCRAHRHTLLPTATDILGNSELLSPQNRTKLSIFAGENVLRPIAILFQALLEVMEGTNHCHGASFFGSNTPESSIAFLIFVRALKVPRCTVLRNV